MAPSKTRTQVALQASVEEMWPAFKNAVDLLAQHCPHFIQSCQLLHGDGGPGTVRLVKFGPASGLVTYAKEEILVVDDENMVLTYLLLEGDLKKQFKVFKPSISLERAEEAPPKPDADAIAKAQSTSEPPPTGSKPSSAPRMEALDGQAGRSIAVWTVEYEVEDGVPPPQIELLNEGAKAFFKLLEASVLKALQDPAAIIAPTPAHAPILEEPPTPLVA